MLCFLRAYPNDADVLAGVEGMLEAFEKRGDLRRHRDALVNTGIAGTSIHFSFFAATAIWLARRWGAHLTIDWDDFDRSDRLEHILPLLALYGETWLGRARGRASGGDRALCAQSCSARCRGGRSGWGGRRSGQSRVREVRARQAEWP